MIAMTPRRPPEYRTDRRSPNFDVTEIPVEFAVIHYTAVSAERTLKIFEDPTSKVSSHFVITESGEIFELVPALSAPALRAWHAGRSACVVEGIEWKGFNDHSIGIELVNRNGNLFTYTDAQYSALARCLSALGTQYPALRAPGRIVGHEHISGFRGKADPGLLFDWKRLYAETFGPNASGPDRRALCTPKLADLLTCAVTGNSRAQADPIDDDFWGTISTLLERALSSES